MRRGRVSLPWAAFRLILPLKVEVTAAGGVTASAALLSSAAVYTIRVNDRRAPIIPKRGQEMAHKGCFWTETFKAPSVKS